MNGYNLQTTIASVPFSFTQGATQSLFAVGPHFGLDGAWQLGSSGLALFSRGDVGVLGASNRQRFDLEGSAQIPAIGSIQFPITLTMPANTTSANGHGIITTLNLEAGLSWEILLSRSSLNFSLGYGVNAWLFTATGGSRNDSLFNDLDRLSHGPLFRCRLDY